MQNNATLQQATAAFKAGQHEVALRIVEFLLRTNSKDVATLNLAGLIALAQKAYEESGRYFDDALSIQPRLVALLNNRGRVWHAQKEYVQARRCFQRAIKAQPDYVQAHNNLGLVFQDLDQHQQALQHFSKVIQIQPTHSKALFNRGRSYEKQNQPDKAEQSYRLAIQHNSQYAKAHFCLAQIIRGRSEFKLALEHLDKAIELGMSEPEVYICKAECLRGQRQFKQAFQNYRRALKLGGDKATIHAGAGQVLGSVARIDDAIMNYRKALEINPDLMDCRVNLGSLLGDRGETKAGIQLLEEAIEQDPSCRSAHQNLIFALNHDPDASQQDMFAAQQRYGKMQSQTLEMRPFQFKRDDDPQRGLRVGFVSGDFRKHSVAYFIEPILRELNRDRFQVYGYYSSDCNDSMTQKIKRLMDHWFDAYGVDDAALLNKIRNDEIDILIDLSGHTSDNRLDVFARRAAPVQASYLGYPNSTGVPAMDWRISDDQTDPEPVADTLSSERIARMPHSYFCYQPSADWPDSGDLPALENGHITFGCFNHYKKLSDPLLRSWATLLNALPNARLKLKSRSLNDPETRSAAMQRFAALGLDIERIEVFDYTKTVNEHLALYQQVDIALDSYPYNGATTTCEALWMGIPVISWCGERHASRMGLSILSTLGLQSFAHPDSDEMVQCGVNLAGDLDKLRQLRATLREQMHNSKLLDAKTFTRDMELLLLKFWREYHFQQLSKRSTVGFST